MSLPPMKSAATNPLPSARSLALAVAEVEDLTGSMRRIVLSGDDLRGFAHAPGQDVMLKLPLGDGKSVNRRYSIRNFDEANLSIELNVVRHGDGPGARWASTVRPGQWLSELAAPRGKVTLDPDSSWHLFVGDDTAIPAMFNMLDALAPGTPARLVFEVGNAGDELTPAACRRGGVTWLHRHDTPPGRDQQLLDAVSTAELPPGRGHVYIAGEARVVLTLRDRLVSRGIAREQMSVKAYWRAGLPNLDRGEPQPAE